MISASKIILSQTNLKILRPKVTKNLTNLSKMVCESSPWFDIKSVHENPMRSKTLKHHRKLVFWKRFITKRFMDLDKLKLVMLVWLKTWADFHHCPSCLKRMTYFKSSQKWLNNNYLASGRYTLDIFTHNIAIKKIFEP